MVTGNGLKITGKELMEHGYKLLPINRTDKMPNIAFTGVDVSDSALVSERIGGRVAIRMDGLLTVDVDRAESHSEANNSKSSKFIHDMIKTGMFDPRKDMWQRTASGGVHIVYRLPDDAIPKPLVIKAKKLSPEVDIKTGSNAYIINYGEFSTLEPRNVPRKLLSLLWHNDIIEDVSKAQIAREERQTSLSKEEIKESLTIVDFMVRSAVKGERNNKLRDALHKALYYDCIPVEQVEPVVYDAARSIGMDDREIRNTLEHTLDKLGD